MDGSLFCAQFLCLYLVPPSDSRVRNYTLPL